MINFNKILIAFSGCLLGLAFFSFTGFFYNSSYNSTLKENKVAHFNATKKHYEYKFQQNKEIPNTATIKSHLWTANHLWIGTASAGLWESRDADGNGFTQVEAGNIKAVNCIFQDDVKNIWVGAKSGLWKMISGSTKFTKTAIIWNTTHIFQGNDKHKTIWVADDNVHGLWSTQDYTKFTSAKLGLFNSSYKITAIWNDPTPNSNQAIFTATSVSGQQTLTTIFPYEVYDNQSGNSFWMQIIDSEVVTNFLYENKQYLGLKAVKNGASGLIRYDNRVNNRASTTVVRNELVSSHTTDNSGNLWVSTDNPNKKGGVYELKKGGSSFQKQTFSSPTGIQTVYQAQGTNGDLWASEEEGVVSLWDQSTSQFSSDLTQLWSKRSATSMFQNAKQQENIYIGTNEFGLWSTTSVPVTSAATLKPATHVKHVKSTKPGTIILIIAAVIFVISSLCIILYLLLHKKNRSGSAGKSKNSVQRLNPATV